MRPAEIRGHPATAAKPASREIRDPLAAGETVGAAAMPTAAALAEAAEVVEIAEEAVAIEAAAKKAIEEFQ